MVCPGRRARLPAKGGPSLRSVPEDERVGAEALALSCRSGFARRRAKNAHGRLMRQKKLSPGAAEAATKIEGAFDGSRAGAALMGRPRGFAGAVARSPSLKPLRSGFSGVGSLGSFGPASPAIGAFFLDPLSRFATAPPSRGSGVYGLRLAGVAGACVCFSAEAFALCFPSGGRGKVELLPLSCFAIVPPERRNEC